MTPETKGTAPRWTARELRSRRDHSPRIRGTRWSPGPWPDSGRTLRGQPGTCLKAVLQLNANLHAAVCWEYLAGRARTGARDRQVGGRPVVRRREVGGRWKTVAPQVSHPRRTPVACCRTSRRGQLPRAPAPSRRKWGSAGPGELGPGPSGRRCIRDPGTAARPASTRAWPGAGIYRRDRRSARNGCNRRTRRSHPQRSTTARRRAGAPRRRPEARGIGATGSLEPIRAGEI